MTITRTLARFVVQSDLSDEGGHDGVDRRAIEQATQIEMPGLFEQRPAMVNGERFGGLQRFYSRASRL